MRKQFTAKQKEVIARRLGYDGPMQGFDEFVASSPALQARFNAITDKYIQRMAKGGVVRRYAEGGVTIETPGNVPKKTTAGTERPLGTEFTDVGGVPQLGGVPQVTAATISDEEAAKGKIGTGSLAPEKATTATATRVKDVSTVAAPAKLTAEQVKTVEAQQDVQKALDKVEAVQGTVSEKALVDAATQNPSSTALQGIEAAQLSGAQQVVSPAARELKAEELVQGSAVNQEKVQQALEQSMSETAQGVVTEDMTTQGQLNKILANFDAGNPPAWAAGAMRSATAALASRGLGASSLAGQAIIQAAIESALPIASQDAQVFQQMGLQNLSNKQQMAVLAAQQRAAFLQQDFDQEFQTRVTNAAKISEIANLNFSAEQQVALENARLAQSVDLANLSNEQAVVMAQAAQIAALETTNLTNRQQANIANAQAFLAMDMKNVDNAQQTSLFKAQQITNAILSDVAAENATKQFNATSKMQTDQFMANLTAQTNQFNAAQKNAIKQFNVDQVNSIRKFNAEAQNERDKFNSTQRLVIDQSNAEWLRKVSTENTAAINATNYLNAGILKDMTLAEYNNEVQLYRDQIEMAWSSFEKAADRATSVITTQITASGSLKAAEANADKSLWAEVVKFGVELYRTNK